MIVGIIVVCILMFLGWTLTGVCLFVIWWTRDLDITTDEIKDIVGCAFLGPLTAFLFLADFIGSRVRSNSEPKERKTIFRSRI